MKKFAIVAMIILATVFGVFQPERDWFDNEVYDNDFRYNKTIDTYIYVDDENESFVRFDIGWYWNVYRYTDKVSGTGEWYAFYRNDLLWFDKDYNTKSEQSVNDWNNLFLDCCNKYYDGMDERDVQFYLSCVEGA